MGAPESSQRELLPEEREELIASQRRSRRSALIAASVVPSCALVGYCVSGAAGAAVGAILPLMPVLAVILLLLRDSATLRPALLDRRVTRFEGEVNPIVWHGFKHKVQRVRFELSPRNGGVPRALEVLEPSGILWRIDGERPAAWRVVPIAQIAVAPPDVSTADGAPSGTRALSAEERAELAEHTQSARVIRSVTPLGLNIVVGGYLGAAAARDAGRQTTTWGVVVALFWLLCAGAAVAALARHLLRVRALRRDMRDASVRWARRDAEAHKGYRAPAPRSDLIDESLPSGIPWTVAGVPAPWRRVREPGA